MLEESEDEEPSEVSESSLEHGNNTGLHCLKQQECVDCLMYLEVTTFLFLFFFPRLYYLFFMERKVQILQVI